LNWAAAWADTTQIKPSSPAKTPPQIFFMISLVNVFSGENKPDNR
jgi:hypothetical protein